MGLEPISTIRPLHRDVRRRSLTTDGNIGRALQQASSPPVCTWVGAKDGSCKDYPRDGCCRVNPAYLLQNFPDSLANKMAVFPSDPTVCTRILAPTKLDSVNLKSVSGTGMAWCWVSRRHCELERRSRKVDNRHAHNSRRLAG